MNGSSNNTRQGGSHIRATLTWEQVDEAVRIGAARRIACLKRGTRDRHGANPEKIAWKADIEGAAAEFAFCQWAGIRWNRSVDQRGVADVPPNIEIRRTYPSLIVRPADYDDRFYVAMQGWAPNYQILGWIKGADAKREEWKTDFGKANRPSCFCVPVEHLQPMEDLMLPTIQWDRRMEEQTDILATLIAFDPVTQNTVQKFIDVTAASMNAQTQPCVKVVVIGKQCSDADRDRIANAVSDAVIVDVYKDEVIMQEIFSPLYFDLADQCYELRVTILDHGCAINSRYMEAVSRLLLGRGCIKAYYTGGVTGTRACQAKTVSDTPPAYTVQINDSAQIHHLDHNGGVIEKHKSKVAWFRPSNKVQTHDETITLTEFGIDG